MERKETPTEEVDDYGATFRETITSKFTNDLSGDESTTWKKIEECVPSEDTDSDNDFKPFINYDDATWSKDDYEWYKKDNPDKEIGYQKWEIRKTHEVVMLYTITAKTKKEAEDILERKECIKVEDVDDYGDTFRETITGKHINDFSGDEETIWKKVEECIPSEDTDSDNDFKPFINYEDADWSKDGYEWLKKEDGTNIEKK